MEQGEYRNYWNPSNDKDYMHMKMGDSLLATALIAIFFTSEQ